MMRHPTARGRRQRRHLATTLRLRARRGAGLVELIVAMLLLSVGLLGVVQSSGGVSRQLGGGMRQTLAASVAQARLDSLTSIACQSLAPGNGTSTGGSTTRSVVETWRVTDGRNIKRVEIDIQIPGRTNVVRYETILPCRD